MSHFTDDERKELAQFVTDTDGDIFAIKGMPGLVGAVYARYSRAPGGFRETLLKEFIREGKIDISHAEDLIERVLIAFGDDSVGELEGAHLSLENISVLSTKEIEDRRIGGSPIEQSTRYVFYDQKDTDGNYRYYRDPDIMASKHAETYVATMDFIFGTYCDLVEPMKDYYKNLKPIDVAEYDINGDGVKEKYGDLTEEKDQKAFRMTYNADIRTKACDTLRVLLPLATKTNVGLFGNGRFFQTVLSHCYSQPLPEVKDIAKKAHGALSQIIPHYVKRAKPQDYTIATHDRMKGVATKIFANIVPENTPPVKLLDRGEDALARRCEGNLTGATLRMAMKQEEDDLTMSHMLFPYLNHPLNQIREVIRELPETTKQEIIHAYLGERKTRRDRPGRAFESGYPYTFDLLTDFGTYKDLMRHRMTTQLRQRFTPLIGFGMPQDLETAGFADRARQCQERAAELYNVLFPDFPDAASYATLHGSLVRWVMGLNDRAAMHLIELRTTPQGHPSYRKVSQLMHNAIRERSTWRADAMQFADHNDYFWSRADSEARQRAKEAALEKG